MGNSWKQSVSVLAAVASVITIPVWAKEPSPYSEEQQQEHIRFLKQAVRDKFKDPDSVLLRNVHYASYYRKSDQKLTGVSLCGEVNAKNGYGGYTHSITHKSHDSRYYLFLTSER